MSCHTRFLILGLAIATIAFGQNPRRFDFGPPGQSVADGFLPVDHALLYTAERGYGWETAWGFASAGEPGEPLTMDGIGGRDVDAEREATFIVDLPPGAWQLTAWLGVQSPREGRFGQCVAVNGKVLLPPPGVGGWGKVFERQLPVIVEGGQARIHFFVIGKSTSHRLSLLGLALEPAADAQRDAIRLAWDAAPFTDEILGRTLTIGDKSYLEVGRHRETPLGALPEAWQNQALLTYARPNPGDLLDYSIPRLEELTRQVATFAAPGDVQPIPLSVYATTDVADVRYGLSDLVDGDRRLPAQHIEVFTVTCHPQSPSERPGGMARIMPELLEKRWPFDLSAGRSQPLYLRVSVPPGQAPGTYRGTLTLAPGGLPPQTVELVLRVLPIELKTPPGKVWHLFSDSTRWSTMTQREMEREIDDLLAHGINSFSGAYPPFGGAFIERDGRLVDVDMGRFEEGLRYAVSRGYCGPLLLGGTSGIVMRFRGWSVGHTGQGTHTLAADTVGKRLAVTHPEPQDTTGISQVCAALLPPGDTIRFSCRFRVEGDLRGQIGIRFMKSYKRDPVKEGLVQLPVHAGDGQWQSAWSTASVPADAPYAQVIGEFRGSGRLYLDDVQLIPATQAAVNYVINPGFEREFDRVDLNQPWPESFVQDYRDAVRALARVGERLGLPVYVVGTDEAGNNPANAFQEIGELEQVHRAGLETWCNLAPHLVERLDGLLDATCFYGDMLGGVEDCRQLLERERQAGRKLYTITSGTYEGQDAGQMPNRYGVGFFFWRSGIDGTAIWTFQRWEGDPYNDFDGTYRDHLLVHPPRQPGGEPVPTLAWEGIREGWKDFRYAYTLEQAVETARQAGRLEQAAQGEAVLQFIHETVPWYNQYDPVRFDDQAADQLRWLIAWTLLQMQTPAAPAAVAPAIAPNALGVAVAEPPVAPDRAPYACPPAATPPTLDGALDDPSWKDALELGGFELHTSPGVKAEAPTTLLLMHDAVSLYLGVRCAEPQMDRLKAAADGHDSNIFADDSIEIFLDTNHDAFSFLQLCFNAAGTRADILCAGGYNYGNNIFQVAYGRKKLRDQTWNGEWQVKTRHFDDRWEAEVVLPFATIGRDSDLIGFFVGRNRKAGGPETSSLVSIGFFHQPDRYPSLLLTGARSGQGRLERFDLPVGRAGRQRAALSVQGVPEFTLSGSLAPADGEEVNAVKLGAVTADAGAAELRFAVPGGSSTVRLQVVAPDGTVLYRVSQPASPPPALEVVDGRRVLAPGATGRFRVKLCFSELDRAAGTFIAILRRDGRPLATVQSPVTGETAEVTWNTTGLAAGFYTLSLAVGEANSPPSSALDMPLAIVPTFLEAVPAP